MISLATIKDTYQNLPGWMKKPIEVVPFGLFLGHEYRKQLGQLIKNDDLDPQTQAQVSKRLLFDYVNQAIADTPFYRYFAKQRGWTSIKSLDQFYEFPVIAKEMLNEEPERFTPDHNISRFVVSTGGTSGRQTQLYMSNSAFRREWAFKTHYLMSKGIDINSRRICLRGVDFYGASGPVRYNPLYKELQISPFKLNEADLETIVKHVQIFKPQWIHGYPSSVSEFLRLLQRCEVKLDGLKGVLVVSEKIYPDQIELIRSFTQAPILTFYGMTERVIFATKAEQGGFTPNLNYGFTEEMNGELIGTGFLNAATRLIRYRTGDEAEVEKDSDDQVLFIKDLKGRWGKEFLLGQSGTKITMTALNVHSDKLAFIKRYQFHQDEIGKCKMKVVIQDGVNATPGMLEEAKQVFQSKVKGELVIEVKIVDSIPLTVRGKHRFIVSEIGK